MGNSEHDKTTTSQVKNTAGGSKPESAQGDANQPKQRPKSNKKNRNEKGANPKKDANKTNSDSAEPRKKKENFKDGRRDKNQNQNQNQNQKGQRKSKNQKPRPVEDTFSEADLSIQSTDSKFAGSSFHKSPNTASLPVPRFGVDNETPTKSERATPINNQQMGNYVPDLTHPGQYPIFMGPQGPMHAPMHVPMHIPMQHPMHFADPMNPHFHPYAQFDGPVPSMMMFNGIAPPMHPGFPGPPPPHQMMPPYRPHEDVPSQSQ